MKYLFLAILLLSADAAWSASYYGNTGYERRVRVACEQATISGGRLNTPAAMKCFNEVISIHRQQELVNSQIRLNNAKAEWYERNKNRPDYRGFPCEN